MFILSSQCPSKQGIFLLEMMRCFEVIRNDENFQRSCDFAPLPWDNLDIFGDFVIRFDLVSMIYVYIHIHIPRCVLLQFNLE